MFAKKVAVSISGGVQRNNLNEDKVSKLLRIIGSLAVNYNINDKWNASMNFANFSSSTRQTIVVDIDSLRFVQTTKSMGGNISRSVSNTNTSKAISLSLNYQDAIVNDTKTTTFYNGNLGWQMQFLKLKLGIGAALIAMHNIAEFSKNSNLGPSLNLSKRMLKDKLQLNFITAYLASYTDNVSSGSIANITLTGNYTFYKKHKIGFSASDIIRVTNTIGNSSELTATVNYGYSF